MSTDRELLELAAKAVGKRVTGWNTAQGEVVAVLEDGSFWQPLHSNRITDSDGDALRLAVKLQIDVDQYGDCVVGWFNGCYIGTGRIPYGTDPYAATRRAIVRAAAEIGNAMP